MTNQIDKLTGAAEQKAHLLDDIYEAPEYELLIQTLDSASDALDAFNRLCKQHGLPKLQ